MIYANKPQKMRLDGCHQSRVIYGCGEFTNIVLSHTPPHSRHHNPLWVETWVDHHTGHRFERMDRHRSPGVVAVPLGRKGRSRTVLVAAAAAVHMGLAAGCGVHSLHGHSSRPVVHEAIVHGCSRADCTPAAGPERDRNSHLRQALHTAHEEASVDGRFCQRDAHPGSVVARV